MGGWMEREGWMDGWMEEREGERGGRGREREREREREGEEKRGYSPSCFCSVVTALVSLRFPSLVLGYRGDSLGKASCTYTERLEG